MKTKLLFLLPVLLLPAIAAHAQPADPQPNSQPGNDEAPVQFEKLDTNGDGRLSRDEFVGARPELKRWWRPTERAAGEATERDMARPEVFTALDTNRDDHLSEQELAVAQMAEDVRGRLNRDGIRGAESLNPGPESQKDTDTRR